MMSRLHSWGRLFRRGRGVRENRASLMYSRSRRVRLEPLEERCLLAIVFSTGTTIGESNFTFDGQDIVINGATVAINGPHSFNSVEVINGGVLTHTANPSTQTRKLDLTVAGQVLVSSNSRIDVTGRGFVGGN